MSITHTYLLYGLESTPVVLAKLLENAKPEQYDLRSDADHFTTREVLAHLADLEGLWLERIESIKSEEGATLHGQDPDVAAKENNYAGSDPATTLKQFTEARGKVVAALRDLPTEAWNRYGTHTEAGKITIHEIAQFMLGHDGYHLKQVSEYLS